MGVVGVYYGLQMVVNNQDTMLSCVTLNSDGTCTFAKTGQPCKVRVVNTLIQEDRRAVEAGLRTGLNVLAALGQRIDHIKSKPSDPGLYASPALKQHCMTQQSSSTGSSQVAPSSGSPKDHRMMVNNLV